jgi:hypothetical protein
LKQVLTSGSEPVVKEQSAKQLFLFD